ncbi:MAG: hypothetical protein K6G45_04700 [Lachnospiraceae bacterium]|nr:hypothetical protein [Lachnospiraceae bacterium]
MKTGKFYFLYLVQLVMIGIFALVLLGYSIKTGEIDTDGENPEGSESNVISREINIP